MYSYRTVDRSQRDARLANFRKAAMQPRTLPASDAPTAVPESALNTDMRIAQAVRNELNSEPSVRAAAVDVRVNDGVVTLSGVVDSEGERWLIESAAMRIAGVKRVLDQTQVFAAGATPTDDEIAHDCERVLACLTPADDYAIGVMVSHGWVTLSGYVAEGYERRIAEAEVGSLLSVHGVNSQVKVRPSLLRNGVAGVATAIPRRNAYKSGSYEFADGDDRVTWSGVRSAWAAQRAMIHATWSASGAKRVVDRIRAR